jgi:acetylornithine aminotransferase
MACPDSDRIVAQAQAHTAALYGPPPLVAVRGEGAWITTLDGRRLLDAASGMGVTVLGHGHPRVRAAIVAQVDSLLHTSNALLSPAPVALASKLFALTGGYQSFFVNSGAEATEGALKLCRAHFAARDQPRPVFVACERGFHGRTLGALSITGQPRLQRPFAPLLPEVRFVPFGDAEALARAMDAQVAAFVVEPVQGNGGVALPPAGYLQQAQQLCRRHGSLFVADEIQTGIGRTGAWFDTLAQGLAPDVLIAAKALGGGLPLGAVLARSELMSALSAGSHGSTFGGNPVACRAALATIEAIEQEGLLDRIREVERAMLAALRALPHLAAVRGKGLLFGIDATKAGTSQRLRDAALAQDLLVTVAGPDTVRLFVPAVADDATLAEIVRRLSAALRGAFGETAS